MVGQDAALELAFCLRESLHSGMFKHGLVL